MLPDAETFDGSRENPSEATAFSTRAEFYQQWLLIMPETTSRKEHRTEKRKVNYSIVVLISKSHTSTTALLALVAVTKIQTTVGSTVLQKFCQAV